MIRNIYAVLLHDFKLQRKINLINDFWSCFLMIIDEVQNYGRPYQDEVFNKKILLPNKVGIHITCNNKIKLQIDEKFVESLKDDDVRKSYYKHSNETVVNILSDKIDESVLNDLFEMKRFTAWYVFWCQ